MRGFDSFDCDTLARVIASKRAAGRPKDLAVLPALEAALAAARDDETPSQ